MDELQKMLEKVKESVQSGIKSVTDTLGAQIKTVAEKVTAVEEKAAKVEAIEERLKKIEALPTEKLFGAPGIVRSGEYKGYKLCNLGEAFLGSEGKAKGLKTLSKPEKVEELSKFFIDLVKSSRPVNPDMQAKADLMEFYRKADMSSGVDADGGFLIPDEFSPDIIRLNRDMFFGLQFCKVVDMSSDVKKVPRETALFSSSWRTANEQRTGSKNTYGQLTLTAKHLDCYGTVDNDLLADANVDLTSEIANAMSYAINQEIDNQILNGTGDPVSGILTAAAGYSVVLASGLVNFSSVTADDLDELASLIPEGYAANARWILHRTIMHLVKVLKDNNGAYVYARPGESKPGMIWEYPYFQSAKSVAKSATGANKGFIAFGNFDYYYIGRRMGTLSLKVDPYTRMDYNETRLAVFSRWALARAMEAAFGRIVTAA
jgi:HK97 family phage major capsid protein